MSLIDILKPALSAYRDATNGQTPLEGAIDTATQDPRVRAAMRMGASLEGGNLVGGWQAGDNGTSFGPFQIHLPAHPDVTADQANDPATAVQLMLEAYQDAVNQVPQELWDRDPQNAAVQAAYNAERPLHFYNQDQIASATAQGSMHAGGASGDTLGGSMGAPTPTPQATPPAGTPQIDFNAPGTSKKPTGKQKVPASYGFPPGTYFDPATGQYIAPDGSPGLPDPNFITAFQRGELGNSATTAGASAMNAATNAQNSAETARANRVQEQINYIQRLTAAQQQEDVRAQDVKSNQLAALPFFVGNRQFQSGLGPNDYAVRNGLASATPLQAMPFDPNLPSSVYEAELQKQLASLAQVAGK